MSHVVGYYGSWAHYREGNGKCSVENIDPTLFSHLIYAFVGLNEDGSIKILDSWHDIDLKGFESFVNLKRRNPRLKTLVAIGGWNEGSTKFSNVCANPQKRAAFVKNAFNFVKKYGFDGMDLDWEYPGQREGSSSDKANFTSLIREMRTSFDKGNLLLTAAVGASAETSNISYEIPALSKYLHFINLMTYDLHGSWEQKTGENAPLYEGPDDRSQSNVNACVQNWIARGAEPSKIILGIPLNGRTWTLANSGNTRIGAPTTGPGEPGPYTKEAGTLGYMEIAEKLKTQGWTEKWNNEQRVPFAFKGNQWVGYDNARSVREKVAYCKSKRLGGVMVWSVETDDIYGIGGAGKWPLLKAINDAMRQ